MIVTRLITAPFREYKTWDDRWRAEDQGLITCWEKGRELSLAKPDLAQRALKGELIPLGWKGGVEKTIKSKKYGSLNYLATLQGIKGEDLFIDTEIELQMTCTKYHVDVIFTSDMKKYGNQV